MRGRRWFGFWRCGSPQSTVPVTWKRRGGCGRVWKVLLFKRTLDSRVRQTRRSSRPTKLHHYSTRWRRFNTSLTTRRTPRGRVGTNPNPWHNFLQRCWAGSTPARKLCRVRWGVRGRRRALLLGEVAPGTSREGHLLGGISTGGTDDSASVPDEAGE